MRETSAVITLTTDFGYQDYYTAAMKAAILRISPRATLIDISHALPPQDIMAGAWVVKNVAFDFPPGSIHLCVVDPGVGSARRPLICEIEGHFFVGPDNGLFPLIADGKPLIAREIINPDFMLAEVSNTFHGRDIFAPAAAHLSTGIAAERFGPLVETPLYFRWAQPISDDEGIQGWVSHIDTYGNLITNIPHKLLPQNGQTALKIYAGTTILKSVDRCYSSVTEGEPVALIGSSGMLEISVRNGNAAELLNVRKGMTVSVVYQK
ncbi:MAG: SAM-dependent chlorinase/fluorinase [Candidatus Cyclonatronum sp.]|uniref:SAM hydrolase/SAM-dependent halogenase family protein n=1 Tax=Cyclonatronum sp. TaxID=3024185 RepID=UPI0025C1A682|nr:SAM-dependent chlorinase/fluorinase [Cyclonatronum sp.]MCH8486352.1 SAM-dependent chlorinase/fluorinase [Cyclonatronum sp.]